MNIEESLTDLGRAHLKEHGELPLANAVSTSEVSFQYPDDPSDGLAITTEEQPTPTLP